jgi:MFS family permease
VFAALTFIPIGLAADRFGRKPLIVLTWSASTIGGLAFLPLADWHGAFIGSVLYWTGSAALPVTNAHLIQVVPRARLGADLGLVYGAFFLGTIIGSPFAGPIAAALGLRAALAVGVGVFVLSTLLTLLLRSSPPPAHVATPALPRAFWTLLAVTPLAALVANMVNPLFSVFVRDVVDVPLERVGIYVGLIALGAALLSATSGRISDRVGPAPAVIGAGVALTLGAAVVALAGHSEPALGLGALLLGAQSAPNPVLAAALERVLPPSRSALGYSGFQLVYALGFGTGGLLSGVLYDADALLPLLVQVALALPVTVTVAIIVSRIVRARRENAG